MSSTTLPNASGSRSTRRAVDLSGLGLRAGPTTITASGTAVSFANVTMPAGGQLRATIRVGPEAAQCRRDLTIVNDGRTYL